jgi:hypothetical protein
MPLSGAAFRHDKKCRFRARHKNAVFGNDKQSIQKGMLNIQIKFTGSGTPLLDTTTIKSREK